MLTRPDQDDQMNVDSMITRMLTVPYVRNARLTDGGGFDRLVVRYLDWLAGGLIGREWLVPGLACSGFAGSC